MTKSSTEKKNISRLIIFGDSLSDSGNMKRRKLFGLFPIPGTGLDKSGDGRFADGLVWPGFFALYWADRIFKQAIPDDYKRQRLWKKFVNALTKPENEVDILQHHLIRNYAEGGATAATFNIFDSIEEDVKRLTDKTPKEILKDIEFDIEHPEKFISSNADMVKKLGAQAIVINLAIERHQFLKNEAKIFQDKTAEDIQKLKDETLITVWAGANDLITVNKKPTQEEVDNAIDTIIDHVRQLEKEGYSQFALFTLPDLTKTPFYQKQLAKGDISEDELEEIQKLIIYFNTRLQNKCHSLESKPEVFDVYSRFNEVYFNAESYGFDPNTLKMPLSDKPDQTNAMFWNDVHPTSKLQSIICKEFINELEKTHQLNNHLEAITQVANQDKPGFVSNLFHNIWTEINNFFRKIVWRISSIFTNSTTNQPDTHVPSQSQSKPIDTSSYTKMMRSNPGFLAQPVKETMSSKDDITQTVKETSTGVKASLSVSNPIEWLQLESPGFT